MEDNLPVIAGALLSAHTISPMIILFLTDFVKRRNQKLNTNFLEIAKNASLSRPCQARCALAPTTVY
jgi:hypothetical protein